jgi:CxxC motif-containing protein
MSCELTLTVEEGVVTEVTGNTCKLGKEYGAREYTRPMRTLTSTVALEDGIIARLPVKTAGEVDKSVLLNCMKEISRHKVQAPVHSGQVVIENVAGTGVNVIATRSVPRVGG